jgi:hypothetical protein
MRDMADHRSTPNRRDVVRAHPLREALLELIDRDGTTTSTIAARELGKPWRRMRVEQATLNRELEDTAYASWLAAKTSEDEDFAFSEVVTLADGELAELRARLHRVLRDFVGSEPRSDAATPTAMTPTAVIIRAFPLREEQ